MGINWVEKEESGMDAGQTLSGHVANANGKELEAGTERLWTYGRVWWKTGAIYSIVVYIIFKYNCLAYINLEYSISLCTYPS